MLDHRQVSQLVVIAPVTVLSCTCSPPQRTGTRCRPVWPIHSTCRRCTYTWESLTSTSSSPFYHVSPVASLCRNWLCCVMHQVCSQGVQHTLVYVHSDTHTNTTHLIGVCVWCNVFSEFGFLSWTFPSQQHAMLASPHHACVSCIVSAAYTDNSRGSQGSRDLFIHLDM